MKNNTSKVTNPDLVEHLAGNLALYTIAQKYFSVLCGSIFAVILAKPDLPSSIRVYSWTLADIVGWYLIIGFVGLFHHELWKACEKVTGKKAEIPEFLKRIFVGFLFAGLLIFGAMLDKLLKP